MLILTRRANESIMVGDTKLTVLQLDSKTKEVRFQELAPNGDEFYHNPDIFNKVFEMASQDCYVQITQVQGNQARIGFDAPRSLEIVRSEIIGRAPKPQKVHPLSDEDPVEQQG